MLEARTSPYLACNYGRTVEMKQNVTVGFLLPAIFFWAFKKATDSGIN